MKDGSTGEKSVSVRGDNTGSKDQGDNMKGGSA